MNRFLLIGGLSVLSLSALAENASAPLELNNAMMYVISSNGKYGVSQSYSGMKIFDLTSGKMLFGRIVEEDDEYAVGDFYEAGLGKCVSDNGIILGSLEGGSAEYWKDGEWYVLDVPENATETNLANAITPDGRRICGSIGVGRMSYTEDVLMQAPCIWNFDGEGYGQPIMLPHPDLDITGSVPQYITAVDMSADGKTIVGQIVNSTGFFNYPIIYKEAEDGTWSYELPHLELMIKEGTVFPENPGEGPAKPSYKDYMTPDAIAQYNEALEAYYSSGYDPEMYPEYSDYMTDEEKAEYLDAMAKYDKENLIWSEKFDAFYDMIFEMMAVAPMYEFNSIKISSDGKAYGCTVMVEGERDPMSWGSAPTDYSVWVFDTASEKITKYEKGGDLNLLNMADDATAIAMTSKSDAVNSFVLKGGEVTNMLDWINTRVPEYGAWINENMIFPVYEYVYNEELEDYDFIEKEVVMTGRAITTPDLSTIVLAVYDMIGNTDGFSYVFDMRVATGVDAVRPAADEKTIYDLSGRKLKEVAAPGIYIINGQKKVVR